MQSGNLYEGIPGPLPDELVTQLSGRGNVRIERIVSHGHCSKPGFWYDQEQAEFVLLVTGAAVIEFEGAGERLLQPGDWLDIPAHDRHRVVWTAPDQDTVWLAVFAE